MKRLRNRIIAVLMRCGPFTGPLRLVANIPGGGATHRPYLIVMATNPASSGTPGATNHLDATGNFSLTLANAISPSRPHLITGRKCNENSA